MMAMPMSIKSLETLPVESHAEGIINIVKRHERVILSSPAGSGKTKSNLGLDFCPPKDETPEIHLQ